MSSLKNIVYALNNLFKIPSGLCCIVVLAGIITLSCLSLAGAMASFSKGLEVLEELEEKTGYRPPFSDAIQGYISQLQKEKGLG